MLKRTMAVVFTIFVVMAAGSVAAQGPCTVGVFADTDGSVSVFQPTQGQVFDVYVVLFTEDLANALSYRLDVPGLGVDIFSAGTTYGPSGTGINIPTANGENVGLGECAIGFGGLPIVAATHSFLILSPTAPSRTITVSGNADEDPVFPVYSNCQGVLTPCGVGSALTVDQPVATESASFGAVKSLFGN